MWKKLFLVCLGVNASMFGRELLPPFPDALSIEPCVPDTFVMGPDPDLYSGVIWGEPEAIKRLQTDSKIQDVFFFVRLSGDVIQQSPDTFRDEEGFAERFTQMGCSDVRIQKLFWEKHPVLVATYTDQDGRQGYRAWVGLNSCVGGWVLSVTFQYPEGEKTPSDEELAIWEALLASSQQNVCP